MPDTEVHRTGQGDPEVRGVLQLREDGAHAHLSVARLMAKGDGVTPIQRQPQIKAVKGVIKLFCLLHALLCCKQNFLSGHTAMKLFYEEVAA